MTCEDNSISKIECEEFIFLEKKLSIEQKEAALNIMKGIILGELARESMENT